MSARRTIVFLAGFIGGIAAAGTAWGAEAKNLILVTVDGLRWQEVFRGPDVRLLEREDFTDWRDLLAERFGEPDGADEQRDSARKLLPFLTGEVAASGILYGNRGRGECFRVTNPWYFSYPGYSEILTGIADPAIDSNAKKPNPNVTFLEYLNRDKGFRERIQVFASWDVFPFIVNTERSAIAVNAGFMPAQGRLNDRERWLNRIQEQTPSPWRNVRLDVFTHQYALEALRQDKPRVLYVAYGETDDFAHDGAYHQYLLAAHRTDGFIEELWQFVQSHRFYKDNTLLLITTDHGRGEQPLETWQHHASKQSLDGYMKQLAHYSDGIVGSENTWFAALGPGIDGTLGEPAGTCYGARQIAATALQSLGFAGEKFNPAMAEPLPVFAP